MKKFAGRRLLAAGGPGVLVKDPKMLTWVNELTGSPALPAAASEPKKWEPVQMLDQPRMFTPVGSEPASATLFDKVPSGAVAGNNSQATQPSIWNKLGTIASSAAKNSGQLIPYISNIANSFRKPMRPLRPLTLDPVTAERVSGDAQRVEADHTMRTQNLAADRNLDENSAAAVKAANLAGSITAKNGIAQWEANTNAGLRTQANQLNAGIAAQNNSLLSRYNDNLVDWNNTVQRTQSENIANAADKYINIKNDQDKGDLEKRKLGIYSQLFKNSGVMGRAVDGYKTWLKENNLTDPTIQAYGGKMTSRKKVFR